MIKNIEEIKNSVDIVDVVSNYLTLKKAGANFKANCPFHSEKSASFVVSPQKQIFHCFGCSVGGDVISFVQQIEKIEFYEAVEKIASMFNINVIKDSNNKDYSRILTAMQNFFVESLRDKDIEYLKSRGLSMQTIRKWGIGYAPSSAKVLEHIQKLQLPLGELKEIGLLRDGKNGIYSHFSQRVMFPIKSSAGKIVGWSGRSTRSDADRAKYVNSIDSVVFNKSAILFGFNFAKEHIYNKKFIILMEGQLDVILSHQVGIKTAVASQGTALTNIHISQIKKTKAKVVLAYDGDKAGVNAAVKNGKALAIAGVRGKVALFPKGQDPAVLVKDKKVDKLKAILTGGVELIEFIIKNIITKHPNDIHGKDSALKEIEAFLKELNSEILFIEYKKLALSLLGIEQKTQNQNAQVKRVKATNSKNYTLNAKEALIYSASKVDYYIDLILDIVDDSAWGDSYYNIWRALLDGKDISSFLNKCELLGAKVLSEEEVVSLAKAIELNRLKKEKQAIKDITKLIAINKKIAMIRG